MKLFLVGVNPFLLPAESGHPVTTHFHEASLCALCSGTTLPPGCLPVEFYYTYKWAAAPGWLFVEVLALLPSLKHQGLGFFIAGFPSSVKMEERWKCAWSRIAQQTRHEAERGNARRGGLAGSAGDGGSPPVRCSFLGLSLRRKLHQSKAQHRQVWSQCQSSTVILWLCTRPAWTKSCRDPPLPPAKARCSPCGSCLGHGRVSHKDHREPSQNTTCFKKVLCSSALFYSPPRSAGGARRQLSWSPAVLHETAGAEARDGFHEVLWMCTPRRD